MYFKYSCFYTTVTTRRKLVEVIVSKVEYYKIISVPKDKTKHTYAIEINVNKLDLDETDWNHINKSNSKNYHINNINTCYLILVSIKYLIEGKINLFHGRFTKQICVNMLYKQNKALSGGLASFTCQ